MYTHVYLHTQKYEYLKACIQHVDKRQSTIIQHNGVYITALYFLVDFACEWCEENGKCHHTLRDWRYQLRFGHNVPRGAHAPTIGNHGPRPCSLYWQRRTSCYDAPHNCIEHSRTIDNAHQYGIEPYVKSILNPWRRLYQDGKRLALAPSIFFLPLDLQVQNIPLSSARDGCVVWDVALARTVVSWVIICVCNIFSGLLKHVTG